MRRHLYSPDHLAFREVVATFVEREVRPNLARWDEQRLIDRDVWLLAGKMGIIGLSAPEEFGGAGVLRDYCFRNVIIEELAKVGAASLASSFALQDDILIPYIAAIGDAEQRARWLPGMVTGELIGAIAMTEPGTGSDLRGIRTTATKVDGGWRVTGSKTFITSGINADLVIVVVRTDDIGPNSLSLLVIEAGMAGFTRGRKLAKIGLVAQDTAELFFDDVFVPDSNTLGDVGGGLAQLKRHLPLERLSIGAQAVAVSEAVFGWTLDYTSDRRAFGQPIADFQATRFTLAEVRTELDVTTAFVDAAIQAWNADELTVVDAAKVKWWATDVQNRLIDRCLQLFGGYGYMLEYPVARAFVDARVQKIFGGANEIMKDIVGRDLVKGRRPTP
jgi:long-chain-acyl-CoA dehydrogenase